MAVMFQQRHYEALAKVIAARVELARSLNTKDVRMVHLTEIALDLARLFRGDNPAFKRDVWLKACSIFVPEGTP